MNIPTVKYIMFALQIAAGLLLPAALGLILRKKYGCRPLPFFVGCLVFLGFALVLESTVHNLVLTGSVGEKILSAPWLYALYGGLAAGLFEECGRYLAFRTVLRKAQDEDKNALMYGAGHGGIECFALLAVTGVSNLVYALLLSHGQEALLTAQVPEASLAQWEAIKLQLTQSAPEIYMLGIAERVLALALQLSLTVPVWFAAKDGVRAKGLLPLAVLLHAAVDGSTALLGGVLPSVGVELVLLLETLAAALLARAIWKRYHVPAKAKE